MICLITRDNSSVFEMLNKYFKIQKFDNFKDFINTYNEDTNAANIPLAIICEEKIDSLTIYDVISKKMISNDFDRTPVLVIKDELIGFERECIHNGIIDDYISRKTEIDNLVERIRFLLMNRYEIRNSKGKTRSSKKPYHSLNLTLRKIIDLSFSAFLLLALIPLFVIVGIIIKLESKGPVFYLSYRAGNGYNIFKIIKFRTMFLDSDKMLEKLKNQNQYKSEKGESTFFKMDNDPRVTKFGSFLRKTSIDELSQIINVLKGDMSLIGNRPLPLYEAEKLTRDKMAKRFSAPAGISGLWQVKKRGKTEMSDSERIKLDVEYAENYNVLMDMKIFFQTFPALLQESPVKV